MEILAAALTTFGAIIFIFAATALVVLVFDAWFSR